LRDTRTYRGAGGINCRVIFAACLGWDAQNKLSQKLWRACVTSFLNGNLTENTLIMLSYLWEPLLRYSKVQQGTADILPFKDHYFDIIIFGFCLYLCDREDLFRIASEADRVLGEPGWLLILYFFSPFPKKNVYHFCKGVQSYKMDYRTLFTWHPHKVIRWITEHYLLGIHILSV
jgi:SAM-dependent methyltransferase